MTILCRLLLGLKMKRWGEVYQILLFILKHYLIRVSILTDLYPEAERFIDQHDSDDPWCIASIGCRHCSYMILYKPSSTVTLACYCIKAVIRPVQGSNVCCNKCLFLRVLYWSMYLAIRTHETFQFIELVTEVLWNYRDNNPASAIC